MDRGRRKAIRSPGGHRYVTEPHGILAAIAEAHSVVAGSK
jgi:hypothetical protein